MAAYTEAERDAMRRTFERLHGEDPTSAAGVFYFSDDPASGMAKNTLGYCTAFVVGGRWVYVWNRAPIPIKAGRYLLDDVRAAAEPFTN